MFFSNLTPPIDRSKEGEFSFYFVEFMKIKIKSFDNFQNLKNVTFLP